MNTEPKILIVDDEEPIRKLLRSRFERERWNVLTAENAQQAEALLAEHPEIAVIVTDVKMPGKSGMELTGEIKANHPQRKVIVMTGHGEKSTAIESLRKGASDYLEKPFDLDEMTHSVARTLREFNTEAEREHLLKSLQNNPRTLSGGSPMGPSLTQMPTVSNVIPLRKEFAEHAEEKMNYTHLKKLFVDQFEQDFIAKLLQKHRGNVTAAAKEAGLDRSNFLRLLRRHKMQAVGYRTAA